MATPDAGPGSTALLTARVEGRVGDGGDEVVVRSTDPAAVNALLVAGRRAGPELRPERRGLEEVVLEATGEHRATGERPMIGVELLKLLRRPRTWVTIALLNALPTLVAVLLAVTDLAPRPGEGPAFLSAVLTNGTLFPLAALAIVLPLFLPIAVAVVAGDAVAGEAQAGTLRYLLVRPVGRTRLLVAKLVSVVAFVLVTVVVVAARRLRRRRRAARQGRRQRAWSPGCPAAG